MHHLEIAPDMPRSGAIAALAYSALLLLATIQRIVKVCDGFERDKTSHVRDYSKVTLYMHGVHAMKCPRPNKSFKVLVHSTTLHVCTVNSTRLCYHS
jgi:hypothetical protein